MIIARINGIDVFQDDSDYRIHWSSGAAIDADGANGQNDQPFAYRLDNKGLDDIHASAGYPNGSWTSILYDRGDGVPVTDGLGNVYSKTTYIWPHSTIKVRAVDAAFVPYAVVNPHVRMNSKGIVIGCKAQITYREKKVIAVVADVSGGSSIGEISIATAKALGIPSSPRTGGIDSDVLFEFWPGTPAVVQGRTYLLQKA